MGVGKKKILFLAHRIPYPPNKGDKIRTFNEIKYLSRTFTIDLMTMADEKTDMGFRSNLETYCNEVYIFSLDPWYGRFKGLKSLLAGNSISEGYFFQTIFFEKLTELLSQTKYHAIFCFSSPMAAYVLKFYTPQDHGVKKPRLVMDFCDVDSEKWQQYAARAKFFLHWLYRLEAKRLLVFERKINQIADASIFVSEEESRLFSQKVPNARKVNTIPNGVDHRYFCPDANPLEPAPEFLSKIIMFAGAMDYYANVEGVEWFCNKIFPLIRAKIPDAVFFIVGNKPGSRVQALGKIENVMVTGFVADIRPYYKQAQVCVVPLRIARGVQNKILEAMAMERPVVSTTAAICGIHACHGEHIMCADTPETIAHQIVVLLNDAKLCLKIGTAARKFTKENFSWKLSMEKLGTILGNAS